jgi:hypothetical protein
LSHLEQAVYSSGNVYVADTYNDRIQKFAPGIQPVHTGYNGKIMDHETSGDTTPGDTIKGWIWVKNTGRYAKFKGTFEIKYPMDNTYEDSKTEIINTGTAHKFEGVDGLDIRIPSDAAIGEYWNSRFILYVDVGYWEEVDATSWEPFKIKSADEPELHMDTPDEEALRVLYGEEVSFKVNVYNADCVKWLVDNIYKDTTTDVSDGITSWRHTFYDDCTVTARAYRVEKSSEPVNWKIEITKPPPAHYPQIYGYSPSDRSLKRNPGDTVDFKVHVKDDEGDLDRVVW